MFRQVIGLVNTHTNNDNFLSNTLDFVNVEDDDEERHERFCLSVSSLSDSYICMSSLMSVGREEESSSENKCVNLKETD